MRSTWVVSLHAYPNPKTQAFADLLIDAEDAYRRAVLVGMLREADR